MTVATVEAVGEVKEEKVKVVSVFPTGVFKPLPNGGYSSGVEGLREVNVASPVISFCWMNADNQIQSFGTCRGYIMEAISAAANGRDQGGYWSKAAGEFDFNNLRAAMGSGLGCLAEDKVVRIADFMHKLEDVLGFEHTQFIRAENHKKNDTWMLVADKRWLTSPFTVSFFFYCLRTMGAFIHKVENTLEQTIDAYGVFCKPHTANYEKRNADYTTLALPYTQTADHYIKLMDIYDFGWAYDFITNRFLEYGIDPLFPATLKENFPTINADNWGMCSHSTNGKWGGGPTAENNVMKVINYAHRPLAEIHKWIAENKTTAAVVTIKSKAKMVQAEKAPKGKVPIKIVATRTQSKIGILVKK